MVSDVAQVLREDWQGEMYGMGEAWHTDSHSKTDEYARMELRKIAVYGAKEYIDEYADDWDDDPDNRPSVKDTAWPIYRLLVQGFARAQDVYGSEYHMVSCFNNVDVALQGIWSEIGEESVGATIRVEFDTDSGEASVSRVYDDEDERGCDECSDWVDAEHGSENIMGHFTCFDCAAAETVKDYDRAALIEQLEGEFGCACYDEESTTLLREALAESLATQLKDEV